MDQTSVGGEAASFGSQLRTLRVLAGLTRDELAERAGLSIQAVGALERGQRQRPYTRTVRALADALDLGPTQRAALVAAATSRPAPSTAAQVTHREDQRPVLSSGSDCPRHH